MGVIDRLSVEDWHNLIDPCDDFVADRFKGRRMEEARRQFRGHYIIWQETVNARAPRLVEALTHPTQVSFLLGVFSLNSLCMTGHHLVPLVGTSPPFSPSFQACEGPEIYFSSFFKLRQVGFTWILSGNEIEENRSKQPNADFWTDQRQFTHHKFFEILPLYFFEVLVSFSILFLY